jgi:hypothetical protein
MIEQFVIETSTGNIVLPTEKKATERAKDLRKQDQEVMVFKKLFTKSGKLIETYLIG